MPGSRHRLKSCLDPAPRIASASFPLGTSRGWARRRGCRRSDSETAYLFATTGQYSACEYPCCHSSLTSRPEDRPSETAIDWALRALFFWQRRRVAPSCPERNGGGKSACVHYQYKPRPPSL